MKFKFALTPVKEFWVQQQQQQQQTMLSLSFLVLALLAFSTLCEAYRFKRHGFLTLSSKKSKYIRYSTLENKQDTEKNVGSEEENVLKITDLALKQLKASSQSGQCLRIGVKSGGCSGMSYSMDFVDADKISESDHIEMIGDLKTAIDPKSLLYIYGLELDYSTELIGGGFKFVNPNAKR